MAREDRAGASTLCLMFRRGQAQAKDTDDWLLDLLEQALIKAQEAGKDPAVVRERFGEAIAKVFDTHAPILATDLQRRAPRMLREHRRISRAFERRLRKFWGSALDQYYA